MAALLLSFFNFILDFFKMFKWGKIVDFVYRQINFGAMTLINVALVAVLLAYATAVLTLLVSIYKRANDFIDYLNNLALGNQGGEIFSVALSIIKALGIWRAFGDLWDLYSVSIVSIFVIFAMKLGLKILNSLRNTLVSYFIAKM